MRDAKPFGACQPARGGHGGAIVNVSSAAARLGGAGEYVDYAASKGAIDTLTVGLAREVAAEGIRVNAVRPGIIDTEIHASGGVPDRASRVGATTPFGRAGRADEVAAAIVWLLSDEASYVSGAILDVTGARLTTVLARASAANCTVTRRVAAVVSMKRTSAAG